jgi:ATP-binding cassette subfamily F protein 3
MSEEEARSYLGRFLFSGDDVTKKVRDLSGGERSRVALAKLTLQRANVLLLDEPTNHLDIQARGALETVLRAYPGSLLFVSHDRYFISALANQVWVVEDGIVRVYRGTYADYLEKREKGQYQPEMPDVVARSSPSRRPPRAARPVAEPEAPLTRAGRGTVDERLVPILQRLDLLERDERTLVRQITSPSGPDLPRLLEASAAYAGVQEGLAVQDQALISTLRALLAAPVE